MPILSVIIMLVLFIIVCRKDTMIGRYMNLFILTCTLKIYWLQGFFIKIGHNEISSVASVSEYVLFMYSVYLLATKKISVNSYIMDKTIVFIVIICIGMIYEIVNPYDGLLLPVQNNETNWDLYAVGACSMYHYVPSYAEMLRSLFMVIMFSVEVFVFKNICNFKWFIYVYMRIIHWLKYGIYYGYLEWILKNVFGELTWTYIFSEVLLGVNESAVFTTAFSKDGTFYTLQGLTREPSYFNGYLFILALLMIFGNTLKRIAERNNVEIHTTYNNFNLISCILLLLLTGGFSAVWLLFIIISTVVLLRIRETKASIINFLIKRKRFVVGSFFCGMLFITLVVQNEYFYNRIIDALAIVGFLSESSGFVGVAALGVGNDIGSTIARFISLYEGVIIFIDRPVWGLSYKVQEIHDWSLKMLINIGMIGMYTLYKMLTSNKNKLHYDSVMLTLIFIIAGLPVNICPGSLCLYWLLLFEATAYYMDEREILGDSANSV